MKTQNFSKLLIAQRCKTSLKQNRPRETENAKKLFKFTSSEILQFAGISHQSYNRCENQKEQERERGEIHDSSVS